MMENSVRVREDSLEFQFYVSAFCATPRPSRFEEMSLIKTMIDEDKIPLLKSVIVKVATNSVTCERSPVFQKLAEKFGVLPRSPREVNPKIEISVTKQDLPTIQNVFKTDILTTNVLKELPGDNEVKPNIARNLLDVDHDVTLFPPESKFVLQNADEGPTLPVVPYLVISVNPSQPSFIHHREVAINIKSEFEQELPVTSVKLEEVGGQNSSKQQGDPLTTDISPKSSVVLSNPTSFQVSDSPTISTLERTLFPNPCYAPIFSWKLSPPTSPEVSSPSLLDKMSQPLIFARKSSPPTTPPYPSPQHVTDPEPNQMRLVDPATFLPLNEVTGSSKRADDELKSDQVVKDSNKKTSCHVDESSSIMGNCSQHQEKSLKTKHRATEHWIVRDTSYAKQSKIRFSCELCLKTFFNQSAVGNHKRQAHKLAINPIKTALAKDRLKNVITKVKSILFVCAHCERKCKSKKSLERHIARAHNVKSTVPCPQNCGKMLCSRDAIKKHLLSHRPPSEWPVSCPLCDKRFQARADVPKHLLSAKHNDGNLPEVGSAGWWALVYWDKPELMPTKGRKIKQGR